MQPTHSLSVHDRQNYACFEDSRLKHGLPFFKILVYIAGKMASILEFIPTSSIFSKLKAMQTKTLRLKRTKTIE